MFAFGLLSYIDNSVTYGLCSFAFRFFEGFGFGCLNSAAFAIISHDYEDNVSNLIGLTQAFTGVGMMTGPILGSLLFEEGGFQLPFFVTGSALTLLIVPICIYLANDKGQQQEESSRTEKESLV